MSLLGGLLSIATSPIRGVVKVVDDIMGENGEEEQTLSILTFGLSSAIKGTTEGLKKGVEDISDS